MNPPARCSKLYVDPYAVRGTISSKRRPYYHSAGRPLIVNGLRAVSGVS